MSPDRTRLEALAAPGGPLEIRRAAARWTGPPEFTELAGRLTAIEWDVLDYLDSHKVEIAPDDFSAQDVASETVRTYFGLTEDELSAVVESLVAENLASARGNFVGLTAIGIDLLTARSR